jgi:hypothetical protein
MHAGFGCDTGFDEVKLAARLQNAGHPRAAFPTSRIVHRVKVLTTVSTVPSAIGLRDALARMVDEFDRQSRTANLLGQAETRSFLQVEPDEAGSGFLHELAALAVKVLKAPLCLISLFGVLDW